MVDFKVVLTIQPDNEVAIAALTRLRGPCESKKN